MAIQNKIYPIMYIPMLGGGMVDVELDRAL